VDITGSKVIIEIEDGLTGKADYDKFRVWRNYESIQDYEISLRDKLFDLVTTLIVSLAMSTYSR
jgi:hypothetical protein